MLYPPELRGPEVSDGGYALFEAGVDWTHISTVSAGMSSSLQAVAPPFMEAQNPVGIRVLALADAKGWETMAPWDPPPAPWE